MKNSIRFARVLLSIGSFMNTTHVCALPAEAAANKLSSSRAAQVGALYTNFLSHVDVKILEFKPENDGCALFEKFQRSEAPYEHYRQFLDEVKEQASGPAMITGWHDTICKEKTPLILWAMENDLDKSNATAPTNAAETEAAEIAADVATDPEGKLTIRTKVAVDAGATVLSGDKNYLHIDGTASVFHAFTDRDIVSANGNISYESDSVVRNESGTLSYNHLITNHWAVFATASLSHDRERRLALGQESFAGVIWDVFPFSSLNKHYFALSAGLGERYNRISRDEPNSFTIAAASYRLKYEQTISASLKFFFDVYYQNPAYGASGPGEAPKAFNFNDSRVLGHCKIQLGSDDKVHFNLMYTGDWWNRPFLPGPNDDNSTGESSPGKKFNGVATIGVGCNFQTFKKAARWVR